MITDITRTALRFWRSAYTAGIRITHNGDEYQFTKALNYWQRVEQFGAFGVFPKDEPVIVPEWVTEGIAKHDSELYRLLSQSFPSAYQRFAAHVLTLDFEVKPVVRHARSAGFDVGSVAMDGGHFLICNGKCDRSNDTYQLPALPAILSHVKELRL